MLKPGKTKLTKPKSGRTPAQTPRTSKPCTTLLVKVVVISMAHARGKFVELHETGKSTIAEQAIALIAQLYAIEQEGKTLLPNEPQTLRQLKAKPIADLQNQLLPHNGKPLYR
jgi:hypothetical protein